MEEVIILVHSAKIENKKHMLTYIGGEAGNFMCPYRVIPRWVMWICCLNKVVKQSEIQHGKDGAF